MQILMIRHGRTDWNEARRIQGRTDIPLNDRGRTEQSSRKLPDGFASTAVWSSPLQRAKETAILLGLETHRTDERLIEMDFGDWEGRTHAELVDADPDGMTHLEKQGIDMRPPGGETPREVQTRLLAFLESLEDGKIILVSHKGVIRSAFAAALDWDMRDDLPFLVDWNAAHLFSLNHARLTLEQANVPMTEA